MLRTGYLVLGFGEVGCFVNNNGTQKYVEKELRHFIAFLLAFEFIIFSCLFIHSFVCLWDIYITWHLYRSQKKILEENYPLAHGESGNMLQYNKGNLQEAHRHCQWKWRESQNNSTKSESRQGFSLPPYLLIYYFKS